MQRMTAGHRGMMWGEYTGTDAPGTGQEALEDSNQVRSGHLRAFSPWIMKRRKKKNRCVIMHSHKFRNTSK